MVEDTECVASDLDEGTDYDFRVRAVPADDDDAHTTSDWSDIAETRTSGTAAPEPTTPTGGGMGNLNVRWTSDMTDIDWTWDRRADKTYDYVILSGANLPRMDAANPCADVTYPDATSASSATNARESTNSPALLCVRTTNPRDSMENLSFAWGGACNGRRRSPNARCCIPRHGFEQSDEIPYLGWNHGGRRFLLRNQDDCRSERDTRITSTSRRAAHCSAPAPPETSSRAMRRMSH